MIRIHLRLIMTQLVQDLVTWLNFILATLNTRRNSNCTVRYPGLTNLPPALKIFYY
jgi:hypothetical protein